MERESEKTKSSLLIAGIVGGALGLALLVLWPRRDPAQAEHAPARPFDEEHAVPSARLDGETPESRSTASSDLRISLPRAPVLADANEAVGQQPSIADDLLERLRELAKQPSYHTPAWQLMQGAAERLAGLEENRLQAELARLELAFLDPEESDRVRGACLVLMGWRGPLGWFEERTGALRAPSPELERAEWIAFSLRRTTEQTLGIPLAGFSSPSNRVTYPVLVRRRATPTEIERAHARLNVALPEELYEISENGVLSDEFREERFTREIIVLAVFGPGAGLESEEREQLLAWLNPRIREEALVGLAVSFALAHAAPSSGGLARRMLQAVTAAEFCQYRIRTLRLIAEEGDEPQLALGALETLLRDQATDLGDQILGAGLLADLLQVDDPLVRDRGLALALEVFLDSRNGALLRSVALSGLAALDPALVADALALSLADEEDSKLLAFVSISVRQLADVDRPAAVQLFSQILADDGLTASDKGILVNQISLMGGPEAIELLQRFASVETDPELRSRALELLAKL